MKCPECKSEIADSSVSVYIEYHVCSECGEVVEMKVSAYTNSLDEAIAKFEGEFALALPASYKSFLGTNDPTKMESHFLRVNGHIPDNLKYYISDGFIEVDGFLGTRIKDGGFVLDCSYLAKEWEIPEGLVLIAGDGHTWIALDYRECMKEPSVVFIAGDDWSSIHIASSFEKFMELCA